MEFQSHIGFAAPNVSKIRDKSAVIFGGGVVSRPEFAFGTRRKSLQTPHSPPTPFCVVSPH
jgi:hypothetical protein